MKILVTGITGFIGRRLLPRLKASDDIIAVCLPGETGLPKHIGVIEADLNHPEKLFKELKVIRPDICVHLAWTGIPDYGFETSLLNVNQSLSLWRYLVEECGCRKILAAGSCWEYGKAFGVCREDEPERVKSDSYFVWAKRALLGAGMAMSARTGISFIWARFFFVYGPGQRPGSLLPCITNALKSGKCPDIKTPHNAHDFVFVDDVAEALALALSKDAPAGVYNVGAGKATPVWKVCELAEKAIGKAPLYSESMRKMTVAAASDFWADTDKTADVFGWRAHTGIKEGIGLYLNSLEKNNDYFQDPIKG